VTNWERIVGEHAPAVFATAWGILGHAADAEDVVQEVFLQAHQFQQAQPVRCWEALLHKLAACRALDRLRARRPTAELDGLYLPYGGWGPEEVAADHELQARLRQAIACLPHQQARVFCLRHFEDLSPARIADALQITPAAVATALSKARLRLSDALTLRRS
jgi:RNA polymerase sigma-70 factor (ECF subfamily)